MKGGILFICHRASLLIFTIKLYFFYIKWDLVSPEEIISLTSNILNIISDMNKTAIVHDWLVNYAGAERCVESFVNIWKDADIYTLVDFLNDEERNIILKGKRTKTSFVQSLPFAGKHHRQYLPLFPLAIEQFDLSEYNIIISSSHAVAKGVLINPDQLHITYCHTPMRYAWDLHHQYLKEANLEKGLKAFYVKRVLHRMRIWDVISSSRVNYFIANSKFVARRIEKTYRREADVIYPPVDTDKFTLNKKKDNYYLIASRFVPYKRVDLVVEAFSKMPDKKLLVIGDGPQEKKISALAGKNIEFIGYQQPDALKKYLQEARAFVFAAEEDFGITVVEAMACGTPVIALNRGGTAETVINNKTGIHICEQSVRGITEAVKTFEQNSTYFDPEYIRRHSEQFSRQIFEDKISSYVSEKSKGFFGR
jgi:glycosyltransferase involved in cell wall biosynthesis